MSVTITDDVVRATHLTEAEFAQEIPVYRYEQGRLTLGQPSHLAKIAQSRFQHFLASRGVPVHSDEERFRG